MKISQGLMCLFVLFQIQTASSQCVVAVYPFNGNSMDFSGNGWHGTTSNVKLTTDRFNQPNSAYQFNGNNSYIEIPNSKKMLTGNFSISAWVLFDSLRNQNIIGKADDHTGNYAQYQDLAFAATKTGELSAHVTSPAGDPNSVKTVLDTTYSTGKWIHIVMTWDGDTLKGYKDGKLINSEVRQSSWSLSQRFNMSFGGSSALLNIKPRFLAGKLDDIVIFNCEITDGQVDSLYRLKWKPPCVIAAYPLHWKAFDISGNNWHGVSNNILLTTDHSGNPNSAFKFNGKNSYVEVPNSKKMITGKFSIAAWIYLDSVKTYNIVGKALDHSGNYAQYQDLAIVTTSAGELSAHVTSTSGAPNSVKVVLDSNYKTKTWMHVAMTWDGDTLKGYLDGKLVSTEHRTSSWALSTRFNLCFGGSSSLSSIHPDRFLEGRLDDIIVMDCEINDTAIYLLSRVPGTLSVEDAPVVRLSKQDVQNSLKVYPSPSAGDFKLDCKTPIKNIQVLDLTGKMVAGFELSQPERTYSIHHDVPGVYFVRVITSENVILTRKVVVTR